MDFARYFSLSPDDIRHKLLMRIFRESKDIADTNSDKQLVEKSISVIKSLSFSENDYLTLKNQIFSQDELIVSRYASEIIKHAQVSKIDELTIVSVGSGPEGHTERKLDSFIVTDSGSLKIRWIGLDTYTPRSLKNSFFLPSNFFAVSEDNNNPFREITELAPSQEFFVIANYVYHHMDSTVSKFLRRCEGASKVFLLEEPINKDLWMDIDYRYARIAFDVLANIALNSGWASIFTKKPGHFRINYLIREDFPLNATVIDFENTFPETSLIII